MTGNNIEQAKADMILGFKRTSLNSLRSDYAALRNDAELFTGNDKLYFETLVEYLRSQDVKEVGSSR